MRVHYSKYLILSRQAEIQAVRLGSLERRVSISCNAHEMTLFGGASGRRIKQSEQRELRGECVAKARSNGENGSSSDRVGLDSRSRATGLIMDRSLSRQTASPEPRRARDDHLPTSAPNATMSSSYNLRNFVPRHNST